MENNQNNLGNDLQHGVQKGLQTAQTVKTATKAAAKAGAGDVFGAIGELFKDPQVREGLAKVFMTLLSVCFVFNLILITFIIGIGAVIFGTIQKIVEGVIRAWNEEWEETAILSSGNALYLYTTGILDTMIGTVDNLLQSDSAAKLKASILSQFESEHELNGVDASNHSLEGGDSVTNNDYDITISSVSKEEDLVGENGTLQRKIDMIKGRLAQRAIQINKSLTVQYQVDNIGYMAADSIMLLKEKNGAGNGLQLYAGIDYANSYANFDISSFYLSDIDALKIMAAYNVQHEAIADKADMWDLMDYCGWYNPEKPESELKPPAEQMHDTIYDSKTTGTYNTEIAGAVQAGENINTAEYQLPPLTVPYWNGTCAPQWVYEEVSQILKMQEKYENSKPIAEPAEGETQPTVDPELPHFATNRDGTVDFSNFQKLGSYQSYGIIDCMYTGSSADITISRSDYYDVPELPGDDILSKLGFRTKAAWEKALKEKQMETENHNLVERSGTGIHSFTVQHPDADAGYYLINDSSGEMSQVQSGDSPLKFDGLWSDQAYTLYKRSVGADADTIVEKFITFPSTKNIMAYKLRVQTDVRFTPRSMEDLIHNTLGLWPGSLEETETGVDGIEYAAGYVGNPNLAKTWTDVYTDPKTGEQTTFTFTRQTANQDKLYNDQILGLATELGYDTEDLISPDNGYGAAMVSMAQAELQHYTSKSLVGGGRYWEVASEAMWGKPDVLDQSMPWSATFVNVCAYNCGYIDNGRWYGFSVWPSSPEGIYKSLTTSGNAAKYQAPSKYRPVPGDLILIGETGKPPVSIGIVEKIASDGSLQIIAGDVGNVVARQKLDSYELLSPAGGGMVIQCYLHPHYPSNKLTDPLYTTVDTQYAPRPTARMAEGNQLLAGMTRLRESQLPEFLDLMKKRYPELYTAQLEKNRPHDLGGCRTDGYSWLVPIKYDMISSPFGERIHPITHKRKMHNGIDLSAAEGVPIYAARDGTVYIAEYNQFNGNYVKIDHDGGYQTVYLHMRNSIVSTGEKVKAGQVIGYCGQTGAATGSHLHYEVRYNGTPIDPAPYINLESGGGATSGSAVSGGDLTDLIEAWNDICIAGKQTRFMEAQYDIANDLYVQLAAQKAIVQTGFNWLTAPERKELLWGLSTTSDNQDAIVKVLIQLSDRLPKYCSADQFITALQSDNMLMSIIEDNQTDLWPDVSQDVRNIWMEGIEKLMNQIEYKYHFDPNS